MTERNKPSFGAAQKRVIRRITLSSWFGLLRQTCLPVFALAAAGAFTLRFLDLLWFGVPLAAALVLAWLSVTALAAWLKRPSPVAAFSTWDRNSNRHESFLSAYCFEGDPKAGTPERLHLERAKSLLERDSSHLREQLPVSFSHRVWIVPVLFAALTGTSLLKPRTAPGDTPLEPNEQNRAKEAAKKIASHSEDIEKLDGLTEKEKKELEKLKEELKKTAEKLDETEDASKRDLLEELDLRAKKAEELAEALKQAESLDVSSAMLAELERHADTADLASQLRAKNLNQSGTEAEKLSERLRDEKLPLEAEHRIGNAFKESMKAATRKDKRSLVGKHFNKVDRKLQRKLPRKAGEELSKLAKQLKRLSHRKQSQKKLRRLARKLRKAGQNVFGRNQSGLRRLNPAGSSGLRRLSPANLSSLKRLPLGRLSSAPHSLRNLPQGSGRLGNPTPGAPFGSPRGGMPIPGSNMGSRAGQCSGTGRGGQGSIPGSGAGCQGGACRGGAGAGAPVPGSGAGAGKGGLYAGTGSAPMVDSPTTPHKATSTRVVGASPSGEGPSQVREVQGSSHTEEPLEETKGIVMKSIEAEEEALSKEPLPVSRRNQVIRYFAELRRRVEDSAE